VLNHPPADADVYLQDEAELALHPTLMRMWMQRGRGRQRKLRAPGTNAKRHVFGATDWRDGTILRRYNASRDSATFCALVDDCVARSRACGRRAVLVVDNLNIHVPERARKVRDLVQRHDRWLELVYLPKYSPDLQPQEVLWRVWRAQVTHGHQRTTLDELQADSEACFADWEANPTAVLRIISSPFAQANSKGPI
jgi:hypothetical protein